MKMKWIASIALLFYAGCVLKSQPIALRGDTLCFPEPECDWVLPVTLVSTDTWKAEIRNCPDWINIHKESETGLRIRLQPNESTQERFVSIRMFSDKKEVFIPLLQLHESKMIANHREQNIWMGIQPYWGTSWTASVNEEANEWAYAARHGDEAIMVFLTENTGRNRRNLQVVIRDGEKILKNIPVEQNSNPLPLTPLSFSIGSPEENISVYSAISDSLTFEIPDWICLKNRRKEEGGIRYEFGVQANPLEKARYDSIRVYTENGMNRLDIPVSQYGYTDYIPVGMNRLCDIPVKVASGEASSFQQGEGIEQSFDGDPATIYHSSWFNDQPGYFPITLTYRFAKPESLNYLMYHPRADGGINGSFKQVDILIQTTDGEEFHEVKQVELKGDLNVSRIDLPEKLQNVTAVRLIVRSGAGEGSGFASCSELEFYRRPEQLFNYEDLFADAACTELKRGIKEKHIKRCQEPFFQNLALSILQKRYDAEFRIQEYHAWMNPDTQAKENGIAPFSLLDNPTGIAAVSGEPLIVLVDRDIPELALRIQDLGQKNGFDGYGGATYQLHRGMNVIHPTSSGLCYVMYHSEQPDTEQPVKIHFASGHVNGYFNLAKHGKPEGTSRWNELLGRAGNKYFDVLSPHVHFTFRAEDFRRYVPDVHAFLSVYDTLVCHELEFEGLKKYDRWMKNRLYIHTTYKEMLYASDYHIGFQESQLPELLNPKTLKTTHCWGPAHELGHTLQVRPSLNWTAMTEVTNNIQSMEIQRLWGNPSRLHEDSRIQNGYANIYEQAMNVAFVQKRPYIYLSDWFDQLVPFWQLRLYLMDVCGQNDFYKDVYEASRQMNHRTELTAGQWQLEFVYNSCVASGMDLRPFFQKWGWLTPTERSYDDYYGKVQIEVTEQDLEQIKHRIDALNLPLLKHAAEYITDRTLNLYTHPQPFAAGSAHIDPETGQVTVKGASGAVAFEVNCGTELSGVSYNPEFTLNSLKGKGAAEIKVHAVSPSGERLLCGSL